LLALAHAKLGRAGLAAKELERATTWMDKNQADERLQDLALETLTAVLADFPNDLKLLARRAHLLAGRGQRDRGRPDYEKAKALEPNNIRWPRRLAQPEPGVIASWNFDFDSDGWQAAHHCRLTKTKGGLRVESTGEDPYITTRLTAPAGWQELTIRA